MKNMLLALVVLFPVCSSAQVVNGDIDECKELANEDSVLFMNSNHAKSHRNVQGKTIIPSAIDNSSIVGKWYESESSSITFNADGTTDYGDNCTYEFAPYQGHILIYSNTGALSTAIYVMKKTTDMMILRNGGSSTLKVYKKTQSVQLVTSLTLSQTMLTLAPNESHSLFAVISPSNASNKTIVWTSSNPSVAKVATDGLVHAVAGGTATITATAEDGSGLKATCAVTVRTDENMHNNHAYVDLGTGVKWATMNIGANASEDYGAHFAWGATQSQSVYYWNNCPYQTQNTTSYSMTKFTKYIGSTSSTYKDSNASNEDALKSELDVADDAAHVIWGGNWRMPTYTEQVKLRSECYWKWVTSYNGKNVNGYIVYKAKADDDKGKISNEVLTPSLVASYSLSDTHIFLPVTGYRIDSGVYSSEAHGFYWSSILSEKYSYRAYEMSLSSTKTVMDVTYRFWGCCIRPVCQ